MNSQRLSMILNSLRCLDLILMTVCFAATCLATPGPASELSLRQLLLVRVKIYHVLYFIYMLAAWAILFEVFRMYEIGRFTDSRDTALDTVKAVSAGTMVMYCVAALFRMESVTFGFAVLFWASSTALTMSVRMIIGYALMLKRGEVGGRHNVLIVGTNRHAVNCVREIEKKAFLGYRLLGFVDDFPPNRVECLDTGYKIVANFDELQQYLRTQVVDEVVICLPMKSCYQKAAEIVDHCEEQGVIVRYIADLFNHKVARPLAERFEGEQLVTFFSGTMSEWRALVKRSLDAVLSLIMLIALSPVFIVAALLVKLTSPGPVFFSQERLGVNKRRFRMYKFRSMVPDAEIKQAQLESMNEVDGPAFKIKDDPRITPIGKLLRKTSIDELPQLFNVLIGDMSLVGPRPLPVRDYEGFDKDWHRRRFSVRPGITCLWQISGRSNISFDKWMELDMKYIDNWSLLLDIEILTKTIPAVIRGKGAE